MTRAGRAGCLRFAVAVAVAVLVVAGCGRSVVDSAGAGPATAGTFNASAAGAVLAAFDHADSVASSGGDLSALAAQEASPVLHASVASVNRAKAAGRTQPAFRHLDPVFAIPAGTPSCFLTVATLSTAGAELTRTDVSQFVRSADDAWKLSHNVQIGSAQAPAIRALGGRPAVTSTGAIDNERRARLSAEVFNRTIAAGAPDVSVLATSVLLDQQFAAGWRVYQQQMSAAGMSVARTLVAADWSACAVTLDQGTLTFLTLTVTDTVRARQGGPARLDPHSPDLVGLGRQAATGSTIAVSRVEVILLLVPAGAPATLLGLNDAPTDLTTTG